MPLADFGKVTFTNAYATINGVTGPIDNWASYSINMQSGSHVEAVPSALSDSAATALPTGFADLNSGNASSFTVVNTAFSPARPDAARALAVAQVALRWGRRLEHGNELLALSLLDRISATRRLADSGHAGTFDDVLGEDDLLGNDWCDLLGVRAGAATRA